MSSVKVSGNITVPTKIQQEMKALHSYLMSAGFPYHSVSVIYRPQDLGLHCIFDKEAKEKITKGVADYIESCKATYSVNK